MISTEGGKLRNVKHPKNSKNAKKKISRAIKVHPTTGDK